MKVLWLCNIMLPAAARKLNREVSNKEGWISGLADAVLRHREENGIRLYVVFPVQEEPVPDGLEVDGMVCFGFREDVAHAEKYDRNLEPALEKIVHKVEPDIVHCFGTEYAHTLAMCRVFPRKDRILVGIQGLCSLIADAYYADLPGAVVKSATFRDLVRRDSLRQQQEKFVMRGRREREILGLAGNLTGRTPWDRRYAAKWGPQARYYAMNETLRPEFYGFAWREEDCIPHSIFLSQGDYPLKGLHYMILALPRILEKYPDAVVYVAGSSLVEYGTWKQKLKIPAYGKYLRRLLKETGTEDKVIFLGRLDGQQMRDRYLKSSLYVCPSSLENSPNSLGEAMLLGMPCVAAAVGGIPGMMNGEFATAPASPPGAGIPGMMDGGIVTAPASPPGAGIPGMMDGGIAPAPASPSDAGIPGMRDGGPDGILYEGFVMPEEAGTGGDGLRDNEGELERISGNLAEAVLRMWADPDMRRGFCRNAAIHGGSTHDGDKNYRRLTEIYISMTEGKGGECGNAGKEGV